VFPWAAFWPLSGRSLTPELQDLQGRCYALVGGVRGAFSSCLGFAGLLRLRALGSTVLLVEPLPQTCSRILSAKRTDIFIGGPKTSRT